MNFEFDYATSICIGLFSGSLILFLGRLLSYPVTGVILAIVASSFIATFIYNPSNKSEPKHRTLRGSLASITLSFIFAVMFTAYYIPKFSSLISSQDFSLGISIILILLFTVVGGLILGSVSGSIASTIRSFISVVSSKK